jgi:Carbohydrate binding domain/PEP-CTERM motif
MRADYCGNPRFRAVAPSNGDVKTIILFAASSFASASYELTRIQLAFAQGSASHAKFACNILSKTIDKINMDIVKSMTFGLLSPKEIKSNDQKNYMKTLNQIIGSSIAIAATIALSASTAQAQNLLVNPGFDNAAGFTSNPILPAGVNQGWATFGASQNNMFNSPVDAPLSDGYALLAVNNPGNNWNPQGAYQVVSGITPGTTYTYSIWAITDTGSTWGPTPVDIQLSFGDGSVNPASTPPGAVATTATPVDLSPNNGSFNFGTSVANNANGWVQYTVSATAPAGSVYGIVYAMFMDNAQITTENMYFDNASLTAVVPEPTILALLGAGLTFGLLRRRNS